MINVNPYIERNTISQFIELFTFILIIFLELLTKVYEVPLYAFVVAFIYSLYFFYRYVYLRNNFINQSMNWERVQGKVINKKLIWKQTLLDRTAGYVPDILYKYTFNNTLYKSKQFSLADRYISQRDRDKAQEFLAKNFKSDNIMVHVNPNNPKQSYIYQDVNLKGKFSYLGFIIVVVVPIFSLAILLNI